MEKLECDDLVEVCGRLDIKGQAAEKEKNPQENEQCDKCLQYDGREPSIYNYWGKIRSKLVYQS